ncbi:hypothetical protein [Bacillus sp. V2I10]|uniref:hypothetical protein n=1 Tax=Bacillus sp. V2I10 TaxID=3042276 RepID=UPI00277EB018|nr:hypothetical protein [Bacillus sp. V2I10]MDQ0859107.1 hypothetical protein [Bacillus sp. V2I10]
MKNLQAISKKEEENIVLQFIDGAGFDQLLEQTIKILQGAMLFGCVPFFIYLLISLFS